MLTSSGGDTSFVLPDIVHTVAEQNELKHPRIVFVDTQYYPDATYDHIHRLASQYPFTVTTISSATSRDAVEEAYGAWWRTSCDEAVSTLKRSPLEEALETYDVDVWMKGTSKHDQTSRQNLDLYEQRGDLVHYMPLFDWPSSAFTAYLEAKELPRNPDHYDLTKQAFNDNECGIHKL